MMVSIPEPAGALIPKASAPGRPDQVIDSRTDVIMAPASLPCPSALPQDVLIVEDDSDDRA